MRLTGILRLSENTSVRRLDNKVPLRWSSITPLTFSSSAVPFFLQACEEDFWGNQKSQAAYAHPQFNTETVSTKLKH